MEDVWIKAESLGEATLIPLLYAENNHPEARRPVLVYQHEDGTQLRARLPSDQRSGAPRLKCSNTSLRGGGISSYLAHSLVPPAAGADLAAGDEEVPPVHLPALLVADDGQVHRLQHVVVARAWNRLSN